VAFEFRLEKVLNHRQYLLEHARHALLAARNREQTARERVEEMERRIRDANDQWLDDQRKGMDVAKFLSYRNHIGSLEELLPGLKQEQRKAADEAQKQWQLVLEREKAVNLLEKLKERYREGYNVECARRDQKKMDETVMIKTYLDAEDV
jgi:flagellar export protein FliJ